MQGPHSIRGAWQSGSTAAGCNNFKQYLRNPAYFFEVMRPGGASSSASKAPVRLSARLQCVGGSPFAINLSVYRAQLAPGTARSPHQQAGGAYTAQQLQVPPNANPKRALASSRGGVYSDNTCGVAVLDLELLPSNVAEDPASASSSDGYCPPGYYCLLPSTFNPNEASAFTLDVFAGSSSSTAKVARFL